MQGLKEGGQGEHASKVQAGVLSSREWLSLRQPFSPATGIRHLSGLTRLKVLSLWNCLRVTHQGLGHLRALPVVEVSLRGCLVDDSACPALAELGNLVRLDMRACERLTGTPVPQAMGVRA